jgi:AraC family transcriptional regulator
MSLTDRALWIIERNLDRPLALDDIAEACGVSRYHLAHAFTASTGCSVIRYARARALSGAAQALADGAPDILDLALASGYGSHEAFSRAFHNQFGRTPESVRRDKSTEGLSMMKPIHRLQDASAEVHPPRIVTGSPMLLVGLPERHSADPGPQIAGQWQRFMARHHEIPHRTATIPFGVYTSLDQDGSFEHVCAAEVTDARNPPTGLIVMKIPQQTYAVFQHLDHASSLGSTYRNIWNDFLPNSQYRASNGPTLERCLDSFDTQTGLGGIEIWIPIEGAAATVP